MRNILMLIRDYLSKHYLTRNILYMLLTVVGIVVMLTFWLRFYTEHNNVIPIPKLEELYIEDAKKKASEKTFEIIVFDSVFVLGRPGGIVLNQNPKPGSNAKRGRKIYVSISKTEADKIAVAELPVLYGNEYNLKKIELGYRGINTRIRGRKYDPGEPDHILEVWYKDQLIISRDEYKSNVKISVGDELEFVLSEAGGGEIQIPNLICLKYEEASFIINSSRLKVGEIQKTDDITEISEAYVISQFPQYVPREKITMGSTINLVISRYKPEDCD